MKGNWNNLQKTLPDNNQIGKLVELKIANTKTSGYINVNTSQEPMTKVTGLCLTSSDLTK